VGIIFQELSFSGQLFFCNLSMTRRSDYELMFSKAPDFSGASLVVVPKKIVSFVLLFMKINKQYHI